MGTNQQTAGLVDSQYFFQIGIGAGGSEVALSEFLSCMTTNIDRLHVNSFDIAASIPSGTRIAMRAKCVASGAAGARHSTAVILGY
jgi:hypothetical protein